MSENESHHTQGQIEYDSEGESVCSKESSEITFPDTEEEIEKLCAKMKDAFHKKLTYGTRLNIPAWKGLTEKICDEIDSIGINPHEFSHPCLVSQCPSCDGVLNDGIYIFLVNCHPSSFDLQNQFTQKNLDSFIERVKKHQHLKHKNERKYCLGNFSKDFTYEQNTYENSQIFKERCLEILPTSNISFNRLIELLGFVDEDRSFVKGLFIKERKENSPQQNRRGYPSRGAFRGSRGGFRGYRHQEDENGSRESSPHQNRREYPLRGRGRGGR